MFCAGMLRQRLSPGTGTFRTKSSRTASTDCCWIFRRAGPDDVASLLAGVRFSARIQEVNEMSRNGSKAAAPAALETPAGFPDDAVQALSISFTQLLADMFALYIKTKNFHWHVSGPHFRDYHLLLDDQGEQIFATTDAIAERVRKVGGTTIRSIAHIARCQRVRHDRAFSRAGSTPSISLRRGSRKFGNFPAKRLDRFVDRESGNISRDLEQ